MCNDAFHIADATTHAPPVCRLANDPDIASQVHWERDFTIGSIVNASVHELKDYGVVLDFAAHADVLGLAATHQVGVL